MQRGGIGSDAAAREVLEGKGQEEAGQAEQKSQHEPKAPALAIVPENVNEQKAQVKQVDESTEEKIGADSAGLGGGVDEEEGQADEDQEQREADHRGGEAAPGIPGGAFIGGRGIS